MDAGRKIFTFKAEPGEEDVGVGAVALEGPEAKVPAEVFAVGPRKRKTDAPAGCKDEAGIISIVVIVIRWDKVVIRWQRVFGVEPGPH